MLVYVVDSINAYFSKLKRGDSAMLYKLDGFLIDKKFQPVTEWFQKLTGKTNFWLAKCCLLFMFVFSLVQACFDYFFDPDFFFIDMLFVLAMWAITIKGCRVFKKEEEYLLKNPKAMNARRVNQREFRIFALIVIPLIFLIHVAMSFYPWLIFAPFVLIPMAYFLACTPLPPCKSKMRKWYEGVLTRADERLSATPNVASVKS